MKKKRAKKPKRVPPPGNAGWFMKVLMGEYLDIATRGYPGWELEPRTQKPYGVQLEIRNKIDRSSDDIGNEWDDLANSRFYWREWLDDGGVFVRDGELYHAYFTFQTKADRDRFHELYGGTATP